MQVAELPAVVIGAGQAGLCASYYLREAGVEHTVLERDQVGSTWEHECVPAGCTRRRSNSDPFAFRTQTSLCIHGQHC